MSWGKRDPKYVPHQRTVQGGANLSPEDVKAFGDSQGRQMEAYEREQTARIQADESIAFRRALAQQQKQELADQQAAEQSRRQAAYAAEMAKGNQEIERVKNTELESYWQNAGVGGFLAALAAGIAGGVSSGWSGGGNVNLQLLANKKEAFLKSQREDKAGRMRATEGQADRLRDDYRDDERGALERDARASIAFDEKALADLEQFAAVAKGPQQKAAMEQAIEQQRQQIMQQRMQFDEMNKGRVTESFAYDPGRQAGSRVVSGLEGATKYLEGVGKYRDAYGKATGAVDADTGGLSDAEQRAAESLAKDITEANRAKADADQFLQTGAESALTRALPSWLLEAGDSVFGTNAAEKRRVETKTRNSTVQGMQVGVLREEEFPRLAAGIDRTSATGREHAIRQQQKLTEEELRTRLSGATPKVRNHVLRTLGMLRATDAAAPERDEGRPLR